MYIYYVCLLVIDAVCHGVYMISVIHKVSLTGYVKLLVVHGPRMPEASPSTSKVWVSDPGINHATWVTAIWQEANGMYQNSMTIETKSSELHDSLMTRLLHLMSFTTRSQMQSISIKRHVYFLQ